MKSDLCEIVVVLDRSGSMSTIQKDMEGGFDTFMQEQRQAPGECRVTLCQFDTEYEEVYSGRPVRDVPACSLLPRGRTALVDAVGRTITSVGERFSKAAEHERPGKVVFMVITDGHENSSKKFTTTKVREMIQHQENVYGWKFIYLGADEKAFDEAGDIGIAMAAQYDADAPGARAMYGAVAASVTAFRSGASMKMPRRIKK